MGILELCLRKKVMCTRLFYNRMVDVFRRNEIMEGSTNGGELDG